MAKVKIYKTPSGKTFSSLKEAEISLSSDIERRMNYIRLARDLYYTVDEQYRFNFINKPLPPHGKGIRDWARQICEIYNDIDGLKEEIVDVVTDCEYHGQDGKTCNDYYSCCTCEDNGCGCSGCFNCNACDTCRDKG